MFGLPLGLVARRPRALLHPRELRRRRRRAGARAAATSPCSRAVQRICRDEQMPPEKLAMRLRHRLLSRASRTTCTPTASTACTAARCRWPAASSRGGPTCTVWVATGDGDCCSIGAGHWLHAVRYNMDMTVMMFDNSVYGLTKKQTSPTTPDRPHDQHPSERRLPAAAQRRRDDARLHQRLVRGAHRRLESGASLRDARHRLRATRA